MMRALSDHTFEQVNHASVFPHCWIVLPLGDRVKCLDEKGYHFPGKISLGPIHHTISIIQVFHFRNIERDLLSKELSDAVIKALS